MSRDDMESLLNDVLLACQLCLGLWQFSTLTPAGPLIQGASRWLVRLLRLSPTYSRLQQPCEGRVFKRANCFVLQADILSDRSGIGRLEGNTMDLDYLGRNFLLQRKGENRNMLFINHKMCYYITDTIWEELQNLEKILRYGLEGPPLARVVVTGQAADAASAAYFSRFEDDEDYPYFELYNYYEGNCYRTSDALTAAEKAAAAALNAAARARAEVDTPRTTLFVKGKREFWREVITGGVMTWTELVDGIILDNQHVSARLNNKWLLPVNLSVSEEKLLKILNLVALFLQTKKVKVHWLIPLSLSFISALLEFNTSIRVWIYNKINVLFCSIMHLLCDPLPRSWRRQLYSLGMWVEDLTPSNDILLKVVRGNMCAIITEGAKVDKEGATSVPWSNVSLTPLHGLIDQRFHCEPIEGDIRCIYVIPHNLCEISAPSMSMFYVKCENEDSFRRIITLVSCIAENGCGSLISYGPNNQVRVRGFEESVTSYVNHGLPPVYKLELANVVVH